MTPSSLSSTHPGHIHITFPRCQNWTTRPLHLLLPRLPFPLVLQLPLSRALWNPTSSPGKLFPIKRKRTRLSHIVKRGPTAPLHSEFFGPCNSPEHSATPHHQHHAANHRCLRTVLRSRAGASSFRRSRHSILHKSTPRSLLFLSSFFVFLITVRIY